LTDGVREGDDRCRVSGEVIREPADRELAPVSGQPVCGGCPAGECLQIEGGQREHLLEEGAGVGHVPVVAETAMSNGSSLRTSLATSAGIGNSSTSTSIPIAFRFVFTICASCLQVRRSQVYSTAVPPRPCASFRARATSGESA
jgi:hypothetical protein